MVRTRPPGDAELAAALVVERVAHPLDLVQHGWRSGSGGIGRDRGTSRSMSNRCIAIFTAPTPSVIAWWIFMISAGLAVGQAVDHGELPQRPGPVEALHGDRLRHVEQVAQRAVAGGARPAQVVVEVEVRVDLPARRRDRQRVGHDALAQAGHEPRRAVEALDQPVVIGGPVEHRHRGDRRPQQRVLLDRPHERVGVAHPVLEAHLSAIAAPQET